MKKFAVIVFVGALVAMSFAQVPIEDIKPTREGSQGYTYYSVNKAGTANLTWGIDSEEIDTTVAYEIVPGVYITMSAVLLTAADTLDLFEVQGSIDGTYWEGIDTLEVNGADGVDITELQSGTPIVYRWIRVIVDNDEGATGDDSAFCVGTFITAPVGK